MARTTASLITFLQSHEAFRAVVYDDLNPHRDLIEGDEVEGTLTYGYGATTRSDGTPLQIGDTISHQEALDRLHQYVREEVEPVIDDLIHVSLTESQYNAIGSLIYNFGNQVYGWRLWSRINAHESPENIALEWLTDTFTSKGEPLLGLYRRRIQEVLWFFHLDWRAGANVTFATSIMEILGELSWDGKMPLPVVEGPDEDLFEDLDIPEQGAPMKDPTPDTPLTQDDRQYQGYVAAVGGGEKAIPYADFMAHRTVVTERNAIKAPNVDPTNEPKAVEDSKTGIGIAKEVSGKDDVRLAAVMTTASTTAAVASTTSEHISETMQNTQTMIAGLSIMQLAWVGMIIGLPLLIYGAWKMYRGHQIKQEGRAEATQLKV